MTSNEHQPSEIAARDAVAAATLRIDTGLAAIGELDGRPLHEHADAYQQLHGLLQAVLADIDTA